MQRFNGQVVIVTGAAHGIGRGICEGFAAKAPMSTALISMRKALRLPPKA